MKKVFCSIVSFVMVLTMLMGCGSGNVKQNESQTSSIEQSSQGTEQVKQSGTLISEEKITLKVMADRDPMGAPWEDLRIFKVLEEMTNIHLEFDVVYEGYREKRNLALATGDLPDIIIDNTNEFSLKPQEEENYGSQGIFVPLNELIEKHAPNIKKKMQEYPLLKKAMYSSDGNIYALAQLASTVTYGSYKPVINKVWLDNLKLEFPETVDDLYNVLKAFRDNDPNKNGTADEIPLSAEKDLRALGGMLMPAFGEMAFDNTSKVFLKDGKVQYYPIDDGFKYYLQYLNKLYKDKLLDNMFLTHSTEEFLAKTKKNICGVLGHVKQADWNQYQIMEPLTSEYNSQKMSCSNNMAYTTGKFVITKANKYPVESIKWADLFYTSYEEGTNGISGCSLTMGQKGVEWDVSPDNKTLQFLFKTEEGLTQPQTLLKHYAPSQTGALGVLVLVLNYKDGYQKWVGENNLNNVFPYIKLDMQYPTIVRFAKDENEKLGILQTDLNKYVDQMNALFVMGEESFDNWNNYVESLKKMKVDEYIKVYQDAYDRFMK